MNSEVLTFVLLRIQVFPALTSCHLVDIDISDEFTASDEGYSLDYPESGGSKVN